MAIAIIDNQIYESGSGGYTNVHTFPDVDVSGTDTYHIAVGFNRNPLSDVTTWTSEGNTMAGVVNSINTNVCAVQTVDYLINNAAVTTVSNTPTYKLQAGITIGLSGVDQSTPYTGTPATAGGYSTTASTSYTGTAGNLLLVFVSTQDDRTFTASSCTALTSVTHADANLGSGFAGYVTATGSSQTVGATWTTNTNWRITVVEVKEASGSIPTDTSKFFLMF